MKWSRRHTAAIITRDTKRSPRRKWWLWGLAGLLVLGIGTISWLGYRANAALNQISVADNETGGDGILTFLKKSDDRQLKGEAEGRINVLFLGMGGKGHPGGQLTDTVMVLSVDTKKGKAALLSIPRDLYVKVPEHGWTKLNSAHALGEQAESGSGPELAKKTIEDVLGIPIHYFVRIDFDGFVKLVDALGGVDINVEKPLNDPFYPDDKLEGYDPFYLKAGLTHMDGELALKYARSRETTSDFDRARRQQQILQALKDKALSLGVLANLKKVTSLLSIAENHIRTDLALWEMERFIEVGLKVDTNSLTNKVLDTAADGPLTSRLDERAGYIIVPRKGNFGELQLLARNILSESPLATASIAIKNASGNSKLGGNMALLLRGYGYQIADTTTGTTQSKSTLLVNEVGTFPEIEKFLKQRFGVTAEKSPTPLSTDFLLVIGKDYANNQSF